MPVAQDRESTVYRWWKLTPKNTNDLSTTTAEVAFTLNPNTRPVLADWTEAEIVWDSNAYWVRLLVGPGGDKTLATGEWQEWVRINDIPEIIVTKPGVTVVT